MQQIHEQSREWVRRIKHGDPTAESELVKCYGLAIRLILLKHTGNSQLANDLSQDTFIVALRKLRAGDLKKPESLAAFIRQTAVNISIQHFRKEKRYVNNSDGIIEQLIAHRDHKVEKLDSRTTRETLNKVLNQLSVARDREILRRFYLKDEDKAEICIDLQLSAVHFDRVLYRAKKRMRELIDRQKGLKSLLFGGLLDG